MQNNRHSCRTLIRFPKAVFFGDSLTENGYSKEGGWLNIIANKLQRRCDVVCRGFSGYNTRVSRLIIPHLFTEDNLKDTELLTLFFGANDSCRGEQKITLHVPLAEFKENLSAMLDYLVEKCRLSREKIILITLPPMDDEKWAADCAETGYPNDKYLSDCVTYAKMTQEVAENYKIDCVDLYENMTQQENMKEFFSDGLHFSEKGSEFLESLLWPFVQKRTENLPIILPTYDEIENDNPRASLRGWIDG